MISKVINNSHFKGKDYWEFVRKNNRMGKDVRLLMTEKCYGKNIV